MGISYSVVIQLAERGGQGVVASAVSNNKVQPTKDPGADVAFNYMTAKASEVLAKEDPVDVYAPSTRTLEMCMTRTQLLG